MNLHISERQEDVSIRCPIASSMCTRSGLLRGMQRPAVPSRASTGSSSSSLPRRMALSLAPRYPGLSDVPTRSSSSITYNVGRCIPENDRKRTNNPAAWGGCRQRQPQWTVGEPSSSAGRREACSSDAWLVALLSTSFALVSCDPVYAVMDGSSYNPEQGSETFKNIAGVGYIILVIFYFFRLLKKRAERATTESLASTAQASKRRTGDGREGDDENDLASLDGPASAVASSREAPENVTVTQCLIGVAQAGTICFGFYMLSRVVDDYFVHQDLPAQYTARNVALLIQSVVRGLVYLVTFIFGANATGLAALAVQMVVDPEGVDRGLDQAPKKKKVALPKVKVTVCLSARCPPLFRGARAALDVSLALGTRRSSGRYWKPATSFQGG